MIIALLLINIFVVLAHESGFFEYMDEKVNSKWKFYHLPKIVMCTLCQTWWLSLLYVIFTPGAFTLLNICLCMINAHLTEFTQGLWRTIRRAIMNFLGWINDKLQ